MAIDVNITEAVNFVLVTLIPAAIQIFMAPPFSYYVGLALTLFVVGAVWKFIKPKKSRGN